MFIKNIKEIKKLINYFNYINIDYSNIESFCKNIDLDELIIPQWREDVFLQEESQKDVEFFILINCLNFSFWNDPDLPKREVEFNGKTYSGAFGLFASLKGAILDGYPLLDPLYLKCISEKDFNEILVKHEKYYSSYKHKNTLIPMFKERLDILHEIGSILVEKFDRKFLKIIKWADNSSIKLIQILMEFPSFKDTVFYFDRFFNIYKKAQLIPAMLYGRYNGKYWGKFNDIDELTIFADYRVPQTLRIFDLVKYSPSLDNKINEKQEIIQNSKEEIEIRLSSIFTCELIIDILKNRQKGINALNIDFYFWKKGKTINSSIEHHRTRTIFY